MNTLIGALSASNNFEKRDACRKTWGKTLPHAFLCGNPRFHHIVEDRDMLWFPCPDNYVSLPQKTRWFCLWALTQKTYQWDYLFKCDDDTYIDRDRLNKFINGLPEGSDYIGHDLKGGYASGGAGYLLSKKAALSIVGRQLAHQGAEDVLSGMVLKQAGIYLKDEQRFCSWANQWPNNNNDFITGHYVTPRAMEQLHHDRYGETDPQRIPRVFHFIWVGPKPFPEKFQANIQTWRNLHPNWEIRLWRDADVPPLINQREYNAAEKPAQKADILRYELLSMFGGVYLDCDFECLKNIEPLLTNITCFSAAQDRDEVAIGIMGSVINHTFFRTVISSLPQSFKSKPGNIVNQTGPAFFTPIARRMDIKIFDPPVFYPTHYTGVMNGPIEKAYAVHQWAHSWK